MSGRIERSDRAPARFVALCLGCCLMIEPAAPAFSQEIDAPPEGGVASPERNVGSSRSEVSPADRDAVSAESSGPSTASRDASAGNDESAAADEADELPALWELRLAGFGRSAPSYPGAEDADLTILPIPIPVYRGSFLRFGENLDQVARGEIAETKRLRLGIDLQFTFGEDSADIPVRTGMPDLDFMIELGPELEIRLTDRSPEEGELFSCAAAARRREFRRRRPFVAGLSVQSGIRVPARRYVRWRQSTESALATDLGQRGLHGFTTMRSRRLSPRSTDPPTTPRSGYLGFEVYGRADQDDQRAAYVRCFGLLSCRRWR